MAGLFGTFNTATRGLSAQQKAIQTTSHNVANANTEGYSRQRVLMETTTPFSMPSMNSSIGPGQVGTGVTISIIQRVRDEFLDYQVRTEQSTMGKYSARDKFLSEIESIFNEPSDTGIATLIGKFFDSWQELSKHPEASNSRTVVAQQSAALADELNHTYNQLESCREDIQTVIKDSVFEVNNILNRIDVLNQQIQKVKVSGQEPNDLMDKRDLLIDELSNKFNIDLKKRNFEAYDLKPINIDGLPQGAQELLVRKEPNYAVSRFSYINGIEEITGTKGGNDYGLKITYLKNGDPNSEGNTIIISNMTEEQLKQVKTHIDECRVLWAKEDGTAYSDNSTIDFSSISDMDGLDKKLGLFIPENGELSGYMSVQEDIDRYEDQLNKLAKGIALAVNIIHSGTINAVDDTIPFFINKDEVNYDSSGKISNLTDLLNSEKDITAQNIGINKEILNDVMLINTKISDEYGEADGTRALAIAQLRDKLINIQNITDSTERKYFADNITGGFKEDGDLGIKTLFNSKSGMTIDNYFKDVVDTLGIQEQQAQRVVENQGKLLSDFDERRTSISGVSLDEEMANLIQYQHAYSANAKVISVVDQLLDVVVNGLIK